MRGIMDVASGRPYFLGSYLFDRQTVRISMALGQINPAKRGMMVLVAQVGSYAANEAIQRFVESALAADAGVARLLANSDPKRLVVVKPNWVQEAHEYNPTVWEPVITHPNLVIAVVEALARRMGGQGTICICDAPHTYASFDGILAHGDLRDRMEGVLQAWPTLKMQILDLRREVWTRKEEVVVERKPNKDDCRGYVCLDLKKDSLLHGYVGEGKYYGADYDSRVVNDHHHGETQEYLISGTAMACDVFINLAKMKTHKKTGITCCLKNLVGINGDKNWLPHHTEGSPATGGDEFPRQSLANLTEIAFKRLGRKIALGIPGVGSWLFRKMRNTGKCLLGDSTEVIRNGNWDGNDTCWRTALDLNRALLYGNSDGTWRDRFHPKAYVAIVDGIIGGQGNGPLCPDPVHSGVLVSGISPAEVDAVAARLMGFDPGRIPIVAHAFDTHRWPIARSRAIDEITVADGRVGRELELMELLPAVKGGFVPHFGWNSIQSPRREDGLSTGTACL